MKFLTQFKRNGLIYLPLAVLIIGVVVRIATVYLVDASYLYDEIIVTRVSRQEISQLLETIRFEPHPPGFYLFLKLLPVFETKITKIIITLINFSLTLLGLTYAYKRGIIRKYNISAGLALFLASFSFFSLSAIVKQDSLSFPILLLFIFVLLSAVVQKKKAVVKELFFANILTVVLLLLGYIYYLQALFLLFFLTVYLRKERLSKYFFAAQLAILSIYLLVFGFEQIANNFSRFTWINDNTLSFMDTLSGNVIGLSNHFIADVHLLTFIGLIAVAVIKYSRGKKKDMILVVAGLAAVLTVLGYAGLFARGRYVVFLLFLLSILAGWGLTAIKFRGKIVQSLIYLVILLPAFITFPTSIAAREQVNQEFRAQIIKYSKYKRTGFLTEHPIFPYIFNLDNKIENVVPVNVFFPKMFENRSSLDSEVVQLDGYYRQVNVAEIKSLLSKNKLTEYIYLLDYQEGRGYYDPERLVLKALQESCKVEDIKAVLYKSVLFKFNECVF
ncbi:MAG: hypothetical protein ACC618_01130 [Patescibacteria group bacterium]